MGFSERYGPWAVVLGASKVSVRRTPAGSQHAVSTWSWRRGAPSRLCRGRRHRHGARRADPGRRARPRRAGLPRRVAGTNRRPRRRPRRVQRRRGLRRPIPRGRRRCDHLDRRRQLSRSPRGLPALRRPAPRARSRWHRADGLRRWARRLRLQQRVRASKAFDLVLGESLWASGATGASTCCR